jgi:hypothetical protein
MTYRTLLAAFISFVLTPLVMKSWSRMAPVASASEFDRMGMEQMRRRNDWIDNLFTLLMFVGLLSPFLLYHFKIGPQNFWPIGLGFGFAIILPVTFVMLITLRKDTHRFHEFWRYYELKWKVGLKGIRALYIPLAILGLVSLFMIIKN